MKTLAPAELYLLLESVGSCASASQQAFATIATEEQCRIISILCARSLVIPCYCDGNDLPHPKVTHLGLIALECAKAMEKTG